METQAAVRNDLIPVDYNPEHDIITRTGIDYSNCKDFFKTVLEFNGKVYTFTGWNSDLGRCYYRQGAAAVARRRR